MIKKLYYSDPSKILDQDLPTEAFSTNFATKMNYEGLAQQPYAQAMRENGISFITYNLSCLFQSKIISNYNIFFLPVIFVFNIFNLLYNTPQQICL